MAELFFLSKIRNWENRVFCKGLAVGVAAALLTELEDTKKQHTNTYPLFYKSTAKLL
jgi:hypothetical protein